MKVFSLIVLSITLFLLVSCGSTQEPVIPQKAIELKKGVIFNHTSHSGYSCESCHQCGLGNGKISILGKDWAHVTCKSCHTEAQQGPTKCKECHTSNGTAKTVAAAIMVQQNAPSVFAIYGTDVDDVAGIEITLTYDPASLSSPTVTKGELISTSLLVTNTTNPGLIKIAAITSTSFSGSGVIATISFARQLGTGSVSLQSVNMISNKGSIILPSFPVSFPVYGSYSSSSSGIALSPAPLNTSATMSTLTTSTLTQVFLCN